MSPASSASSLRPFLTRTSLVRGNATRRSPIAVSPRMVPIVTIGRSMIGGSTRGEDRMTWDGREAGFLEGLFLEDCLSLKDLAGLFFLACFLFIFLDTARVFPGMLALA